MRHADHRRPPPPHGTTVRLSHFTAFAPVCPVCVRAGRSAPKLVIAAVAAGSAAEVTAGTLHCPGCRHEYPVVDGIPLIVPELRRLLGERGIELLLRDDLDTASESLIGDAIGPDSWLDGIRQTQSTYGWDGYGDLDPAESFSADGPVPDGSLHDGLRPGAARRCLARLLELAPAAADASRMLDLGCAVGRTSFDLADAHPQALVLGIDIHLGLLRLAHAAARGSVCYPRRRIGLVYDRRRFAVAFAGAARVDFWACDALALPFAPAVAELCLALNLLDCVLDPRRLLQGMADATAPGGRILLATPYDWSTRATPLEAWLGGHSQRAAHGGAGEAFLHALIGDAPDADPFLADPPPADPHAVQGLARIAEQAEWPWATRLHARSAVQYRTHLLALRRVAATPRIDSSV
jgi:SAM-dependent methyltransferase